MGHFAQQLSAFAGGDEGEGGVVAQSIAALNASLASPDPARDIETVLRVAEVVGAVLEREGAVRKASSEIFRSTLHALSQFVAQLPNIATRLSSCSDELRCTLCLQSFVRLCKIDIKDLPFTNLLFKGLGITVEKTTVVPKAVGDEAAAMVSEKLLGACQGFAISGPQAELQRRARLLRFYIKQALHFLAHHATYLMATPLLPAVLSDMARIKSFTRPHGPASGDSSECNAEVYADLGNFVALVGQAAMRIGAALDIPSPGAFDDKHHEFFHMLIHSHPAFMGKANTAKTMARLFDGLDQFPVICVDIMTESIDFAIVHAFRLPVSEHKDLFSILFGRILSTNMLGVQIAAHTLGAIVFKSPEGLQVGLLNLCWRFVARIAACINFCREEDISELAPDLRCLQRNMTYLLNTLCAVSTEKAIQAWKLDIYEALKACDTSSASEMQCIAACLQAVPTPVLHRIISNNTNSWFGLAHRFCEAALQDEGACCTGLVRVLTLMLRPLNFQVSFAGAAGKDTGNHGHAYLSGSVIVNPRDDNIMGTLKVLSRLRRTLCDTRSPIREDAFEYLMSVMKFTKRDENEKFLKESFAALESKRDRFPIFTLLSAKWLQIEVGGFTSDSTSAQMCRKFLTDLGDLPDTSVSSFLAKVCGLHIISFLSKSLRKDVEGILGSSSTFSAICTSIVNGKAIHSVDDVTPPHCPMNGGARAAGLGEALRAAKRRKVDTHDGLPRAAAVGEGPAPFPARPAAWDDLLQTVNSLHDALTATKGDPPSTAIPALRSLAALCAALAQKAHGAP